MKNRINRVLNLLAYLSLCFMAGTGLMMWFRLPPRQGRLTGGHHGEFPTIFGLDRHDWGQWHFYIAVAFLLVIVAHLVMNRVWLCKIAGCKRTWPLWTGLALGLAIVLLFILAPVR